MYTNTWVFLRRDGAHLRIAIEAPEDLTPEERLIYWQGAGIGAATMLKAMEDAQP